LRITNIIAGSLLSLAIAAGAFVYLAPESATGIVLQLDRSRAGLVRREITLPSGVHYAYLEGGTGEPLMLLHGFGADKDNFTRVAAHLTSRYRVIVPDQVGFGESSHLPDGDYRSQAQADRLHQLALALGIRRVHLGGSSMGGQISMAYAAKYPAAVSSLWLLAPAGVWSAPKSELARLTQDQGRNPLIARNEDEFAQMVDFVMSDPPFVPRVILNVWSDRRRFHRRTHSGHAGANADCVGRPRPRAQRRQCRCIAQAHAAITSDRHARHRTFANDGTAEAKCRRLSEVSRQPAEKLTLQVATLLSLSGP
jgi:pimeloyl-ACP methyl ester carboxylesterase